MGMPIIIEIVDKEATKEAFDKAFEYLEYVDKTFSTFKSDSEISRINKGEIKERDWSADMKYIFELAEMTGLLVQQEPPEKVPYVFGIL